METDTTLIGVAHALAMLDSHEEAMKVIREQTSSIPMISYAYGARRPSVEAESWAVLWANLRTLNPHSYNYDKVVADARRYLAEHNDEHIAWEQRLVQRLEGRVPDD